MKGYKKISCLIFLMIFPFVFIYPQTNPYKFRHLTTKNGLPSNCVYSIIKDSDGFMWFATNNGFSRYDGYQIKTFSLPADFLSDSQDVMNVMEDKDNNMWIATRERGLFKFNRTKGSLTSYKNDTNSPKSLSHNSIYTVFQDKMGILWVGTNGGGLNRFDPEREVFISYSNGRQKEDNRKNRITTIYEDNSGIFWIGTMEGLFQFDRKKELFHAFDFGLDIPARDFKGINFITEDDAGNLWIGSGWGIIILDKNTTEVENFLPFDMRDYTRGPQSDFYLSNLFVVSIIQSNYDDSIFWIATRWGLNKFDYKKRKFEVIFGDPNKPESISTSQLMGLNLDENGLLWISTSDAGVEVLNTVPSPFNQVIMKDSARGSSFRYASASFLEDKQGNLWVGGIDGGLFLYDRDLNFVSRYKKWEFAPDIPHNNRIDCLYEDSDNNLWLGFQDWGLVLFDKEEMSFNEIKMKSIKNTPKPITFDNIIEDKFGTLWIGTDAGVFLKELNEDLMSPAHLIDHDVLSKSRIIRIFEDQENNLWISTLHNGIFCLFEKDHNSMNFVHFCGSQLDTIGYYINSIYEDKKGILWFGSNKGLSRYNVLSQQLEPDQSFNEEYKGSVIEIHGDNFANLWIFHATFGLMRYQPYDEKYNNVKVFDMDDGLPFDKFNTYMSFINSFYQSHDGRLFLSSAIGTGDGFLWFYPDSIKDNKQLPNVVINKMNIGDNEFLSDTNILYKKHISLNYNQNFFSFEFAALDYLIPEKNQYAYYLEGYEEDWIYSGNRKFANYTGVPPGNYIFRVNGSNNDGYWNEKGSFINITILPPLWRTWWAYCLYGLAFFVIIFSILRFYIRRQRLLHSLEIEKVETEKLKELDGLKTKFFTNISHEFRTPLTLILGPLQEVISNVKDQSDKHVLSMVLNNAVRLKDLVNQLLSLSKLESGKMKLQCAESNIIEFVRTYVQSFESLAKNEAIDLVFSTGEKEILVFLDKEKLAQVLNNLLSNAFKFTGEGGRIEISITSLESGTGVNIFISDTGQGIPPEKLEYIFDRFYQADDSISRDKEGTGIGLAIVKEMVNLHHGRIEVESTVGKGTIFSIYLPMGSNHLKPAELKTPKDSDFEQTTFIQRKPDGPALKDTEVIDENETGSSISLLIVEDNPDMRTFIQGYFINDFKILEAGNGKDGLKMATDHIPDIIISDVMMPKMDGYEFCQKLKTDERTSHIPVILLTARASKESRMEGLETGADDFITKPFDGEELQLRVKNLIDQRKKLSDHFKKNFEILSEIKKEQVLTIDEKFLQKAKTVVNKNLSNPDYGVEEFSSDMALSRFQLHRKLSALVNQSTTEFIRIIRLNYAMDLMKKRIGNISEIAYDAGFNNQTYFSISFKKQFGISPTEYLKQLDQK